MIDSASQLLYGRTSVLRTTYTFDTAGNQQRELSPTGGRTTVSWNYENQPTLYQLPTGARATYLYNAENRRVNEEV